MPYPYPYKRVCVSRSEEPVRPAVSAMEAGETRVFRAVNPETVRTTCSRLSLGQPHMRFSVRYNRVDGSTTVTRLV